MRDWTDAESANEFVRGRPEGEARERTISDQRRNVFERLPWRFARQANDELIRQTPNRNCGRPLRRAKDRGVEITQIGYANAVEGSIRGRTRQDTKK